MYTSVYDEFVFCLERETDRKKTRIHITTANWYVKRRWFIGFRCWRRFRFCRVGVQRPIGT